MQSNNNKSIIKKKNYSKIFWRMNRIVSHGLLLNPPFSFPLLTLAWNIAIPLNLPGSTSSTEGMQ